MMSRDKQIEGMAKDIQNTYLPINQGNVTVGETRLYSRDAHRLAENLYNAGYRKASDVIDEFAERLKNELSFGRYIKADQIDQIANEMKGEGK